MENFELGHEMEKDVVLLVKRVGQRSFISRSVRVFFLQIYPKWELTLFCLFLVPSSSPGFDCKVEFRGCAVTKAEVSSNHVIFLSWFHLHN